MYKKIGPNLLGRDFVIGDIHGCLSLVEEALSRVSFDPKKDRLFSVGDLIDRGPDNPGVLRLFLENDWAIAVRGNHEDFLIEDFETWKVNESWFLEQLDAKGQQWLRNVARPAMARWPTLLTVSLPDGGVFHVVHAELFAGESERPGRHPSTISDAQILDGSIDRHFFEVAHVSGYDGYTKYADRLLWGRSLIQDLHATFRSGKNPVIPREEPGLSTVYCGHSICPHIEGVEWRYRSHQFIDFGSFAHYLNPELAASYHGDFYGLCLVNAMTGEQTFVRGDQIFS